MLEPGAGEGGTGELDRQADAAIGEPRFCVGQALALDDAAQAKLQLDPYSAPSEDRRLFDGEGVRVV
jgi:hypothetical protein